MPVGEGAIRVRTGRSGIELETVEGAGAPLSTRLWRAPSPGAAAGWLADQVEAQTDRWTLWTPVALGLGCALYFVLPREPEVWVAWLTLAGCAALLAASMRWRWSRSLTVALVLSACALGGFSVAKLRERAVQAPVAPPLDRPQRFEGWVVDVAQPGESGQRLLIAPVRVGGWPTDLTPIRVRVTLRPGMAIPAPRETVRLLALLNPPPPPAAPGAYDFSRDAYFESVGAVGLALTPPEATLAKGPAPWRLRLTMKINAIRWDLTRRIVETLGPETGGLAAAMTTGHEAYVSNDQVENLRASGLAHIISISGLHMAIVGGFAFGFARLAVAAWPWLALRTSGKKLAALFGLAAVGGYLVLSGAPPPAERAAITAAVAFAAILVDRQAISLHALALAAMGVLLLRPEAVTEPGFQMSFAATAALVALAEVWPKPVREIDVPWPIHAFQTAATWIVASLAVSFVAGLATAPFSIQHFNRVATWGLFANLTVAPISSFLLMPALAVGAALAPFGLGKGPLELAGIAIEMINKVASWAAEAPLAEALIPSGPAWVLPASFLGILLVCLWRGPLRWIGLPLALAVLWAPRPPAPDIWVASDGAAVAVRDGREAVLFRPDVKLFGAEFWARRRGLVPILTEEARDRFYACDRLSCAPGPTAAVKVAGAWNVQRPLPPERIAQLCEGAEVVVIRNDFRPAKCGAQVLLTGADFAAGGAAELYRGPEGWTVQWAQPLRGRRPLDLGDRSEILVVPADEPHQLALHGHLVGAEDAGLVVGVGGLQRDRGALAAQALQGRFLAVDQGHDDLAGVGGVGLADDHEIAVEDAGVDHRIPGDLQDEVLAGAEDGLGHADAVALLLDRLDGGAGGDAAKDGQFAGVVGGRRHGSAGVDELRLEGRSALGRRGGGGLLRQLHNLQRPGPVGQAAQEAALLEGGDQAVDAGLGG